VKKFFCLLLILFALMSAWGAPKGIQTVRHQSVCLNAEKTFNIFVPPNAKPDERFPVLFILHGAYGGCDDWTSRTRVAELARNYRMILVFPDGSPNSWYVNSPIEKNMSYETYLSHELPALIDSRYPTVANSEGRGIMGLSMGGHGALLMAAKHPDVFGSASSLSGILKITNHPKSWDIPKRLGAFDENRALWESNSVWEQAERFTSASVRLLFDCGVDDTKTGAIEDNRLLHEKLTSLGVPHIWRELPGTHSWDYWGGHLEEHLDFHQSAMLKQTPGLDKLHNLYIERIGKFHEENSRLALQPPEAKPSVCLFGSSSMQGFPTELLSDVRVFNRGISADVLGIGTRGLSHRLECSVFDMKPDYVVIKIGRNDVGRAKNEGDLWIEKMISEYDKILTKTKERLPKSKIIVCTSLPVRDSYAHLAPYILKYNAALAKLAERQNTTFLDIHTPLVGTDGLLKPEYSRDGLHISRAGYEIWAKRILEMVKE